MFSDLVLGQHCDDTLNMKELELELTVIKSGAISLKSVVSQKYRNNKSEIRIRLLNS